MKKVLIINASARTLDSKTRGLTNQLAKRWEMEFDKPQIKYRELGNTSIPHINEAWITATLKPASDRSEAENEILTESNTYIAELKEADVIVIGSPMYNWSIPSSLKAYIDQVMRVNETFKIDRHHTESPYVGLLENKTLFLLLSRGNQGYEEGEANAHMNFQSTYLKHIFYIMGVRNMHMVAINGASLDKDVLVHTIGKAHQELQELIIRELN